MMRVLFIVFVSAVCYFMQLGCANIVPPTGGPKDTLPPLLLNVTPGDSTLGFNAKKITLNFNEYVQLENIQKNLLVNPTPKINPTVEQKLRTITVTLRDTLEENTTYTVDFGNAIKDLNEGNRFGRYRYSFSTGNYLDSLTLGGKVLIAETGKADSTLIVLLYTQHEDSAVIKERSRYIAKVDTSGNFRFTNLAPGTYSIYALKDEGARRYLSKDQLFAFYDTTVSSESRRNDIMLYAFKEKDTVPPSSATPVAEAPRKGQKEVQALRIQSNVGNGQLDLLSQLELSFSAAPLRHFDSTLLVLTDTLYQPLEGYAVTLDSTAKKITVSHKWTENTPYRLLIDSTVAEDTLGRRFMRSDTLEFVTQKATDYGLVRIRFTNLPLEKNPLLLLLQGGTIKATHVFTDNVFFRQLFPPGEYELRIVFDENRNGEWDTGQFFRGKRQPEKVRPIDQKISVKPNWDTELEIVL